jgi:hypothetical protein
METKRVQSWDELYQMGVHPKIAAQQRGCSMRTAFRAMAAAHRKSVQINALNAAARSVRIMEISRVCDQSNWPREFREMADRIAREGPSRVPDSDRDAVLRGLPRGFVAGR